jgi:5'-phosphate synthase pdxT subunit
MAENEAIVVIGVVALQGAYQEHMVMLSRIPGVLMKEVRRPEDLEACDGLIIPGGESTVIGRLAATSGLLEPLRKWTGSNKPTWGTCAGLIMMADRVEGTSEQRQELLGGLHCTVRRNYFGSQSGSFSKEITFESTADPCVAVFIRAPAVTEIDEDVSVLSTVKYEPQSKDAFDQAGKEVVVAVQQGNLMGTAFHPELIQSDSRWHHKFVALVRKNKVGQKS